MLCFLTKINETVFSPTSYFNHKTFFGEIAKVLRSLKKHCIAFTRKSTTLPPRNFAMLSQKFCSPNKICACSQIFCINSQKLLRFPQETLHSLAKLFQCLAKQLSSSSWSYLIFPSQSLFVFNATPAFVAIFTVIKMYGWIISGFYYLFLLKTLILYLA